MLHRLDRFNGENDEDDVCDDDDGDNDGDDAVLTLAHYHTLESSPWS